MIFSLICAYEYKKKGIGINNALPWNIKKDLQYFKNITTNVEKDNKIEFINSVIMGYNTWTSIPEKYKPLEKRINIIITNKEIVSNNKFIIYIKWYDLTKTLMEFNNQKFKCKDKMYQINKNFIIGGEAIYKLALQSLNINTVYITEIYNKYECDRYFPEFNNKFKLTNVSSFQNENNNYFRFLIYKNNNIILETEIWKNKEELNYLLEMNNILTKGLKRNDRTGTGTLSLFGLQLKYNLQDTFPISTTKRIFFRGIFEELMLYLRGQTDNKILNEKKIHIWDGNTSKDFLKKRNLNYEEGDMGETYGFNFRHFGGTYKGCSDTHTDGFDQLKEVIRLIKEDPESRRIIINLWNPLGNLKSALPSCLCMYQFYVDTINKKLNLQIYIRSSDYFLANNWNTCTGAIFVHLLCQLEDIELSPGELTVVVGDAHLYLNHLEQVKENLRREPYPFPKLNIKCSKKNIEEFKFEDLELIGYKYYPNIKAELSI
jgi:dihydrofolate reductase / thymidylate synthase